METVDELEAAIAAIQQVMNHMRVDSSDFDATQRVVDMLYRKLYYALLRRKNNG